MVKEALVVSFGIHVFFHHDSDIKDGGNKEKVSKQFSPAEFEPATLGSLVRRSTT